MPAVQRRSTQGTNLFSNILVSFEKKVQTRSHEITLENIINSPGTVTITTLALNQGQNPPALAIDIGNNLPHDLPTGTFSAKEIQLSLVFLQKGIQVAGISVMVSDAKRPLAAGETQKFTIPLSPAAVHADTLHLKLERHSEGQAERPPIILSTKTIDSVSEAFH